MPVTITWSLSNGGVPITEPQNHGSGGVGTFRPSAAGTEIYLAHDGANQITNCKFHLAQYSGTYTGGASAAADYLEMLAWGDSLAAGGPAEASEFGGFQINMDAVGGYAAAWPTHASKGGVGDTGVAFRTGVGDSAADGVNLHASTGATSTGVIPVGEDPNVRFKCRIQIPTDEAVLGIRQFDQKLRYTYTS